MASASASPPMRLLHTALRAAPWLVPVLAAALVVLTSPFGVERLRDLLFDRYQRIAPRVWTPDLPLRIVAIDDEAIARFGQWPWPRARIAELLTRIGAYDPAVVAFDILFSEEDRLAPETILREIPDLPEKRALAAALAHQGPGTTDPLSAALAKIPAVLAMTLSREGPAQPFAPASGFVVVGDEADTLPPRFARAILPLAGLRATALGLGAINYLPDGDLIVRRAPLVLALGPPGNATLVPALATEALRVAQSASALRALHVAESPILTVTGASRERNFGGNAAIVSLRLGDIDIPTEADGQLRIRFAGHQPGRFISAARIFDTTVPPDEIAGRIVLLGVTAASLGDLRATPLDAVVPGVEVHAEALEHMITGAALLRPDFAPALEMLASLLGGLLTAWAATRLRPAAGAASVILLVALAGLASWEAFTRLALLYDPLVPAAGWLTTWASTTVFVFRRTERERRSIRLAFARYLAPAVVERLASDPGSLKLGGEARMMTVLFCDIRDFTARAETLSAEGVVAFLHRLLTPLTEAILTEAGTIDKYLGDGLMAFWNAPLDVPDHATRACRAALEMQRAVARIDAEINAEDRAAGRAHLPVRIGIGINTGEAFVGNMGAEQRFDYSIIGDPVNVAARLESATKEFAAPILVSEATMQAASGLRFVALGQVSLKGRQASTRVYAPVDDSTVTLPDDATVRPASA